MKKRYLLIVAVLAAGAGVAMIAVSRGQAVSMAQAIIAKDKAGDDTKADIEALTSFVSTHTRASVGFTLDGSYGRAVAAAQQQAAGSGGSSAVYQAAQQACTSRNPVTTANCITQYVQSHTAPGQQPKPVVLPDKSIYSYQLESPAWTFDVAGLLLLGSAVLLAVTGYLAIIAAVSRPQY
jgi:hypothetical protein